MNTIKNMSLEEFKEMYSIFRNFNTCYLCVVSNDKIKTGSFKNCKDTDYKHLLDNDPELGTKQVRYLETDPHFIGDVILDCGFTKTPYDEVFDDEVSAKALEAIKEGLAEHCCIRGSFDYAFPFTVVSPSVYNLIKDYYRCLFYVIGMPNSNSH